MADQYNKKPQFITMPGHNSPTELAPTLHSTYLFFIFGVVKDVVISLWPGD